MAHIDRYNENMSSVAVNAVLNYRDSREASSGKLRSSIVRIYEGYSSKNLRTIGGVVDYDNASNQKAYVLLFFAKHCHAVSHGLSQLWFPEMKPHFINFLMNSLSDEKFRLNVCSIGGGPGSDIVGLQMMLRNIGLNPLCHIRGYVLDQFPEWSNMWEKISSQMYKPPRVNFFKYDVGNTPSVFHKYAVKQSRLITLVKFISAVRKQKGALEGMISLLTHASPGAYMFYADNKDGGENVSFFIRIAIMAGFELVHYSHSEIFIENDPLYSAVMMVLNRQPKRSVRMTYMLFRKKLSSS